MQDEDGRPPTTPVERSSTDRNPDILLILEAFDDVIVSIPLAPCSDIEALKCHAALSKRGS